MAKKTFRVAGVTFSNGMFTTSRQEAIKKYRVGDPVIIFFGGGDSPRSPESEQRYFPRLRYPASNSFWF